MVAEQTRSIRKAHAVYTTTEGERVPGVTSILALKSKDLTNWAFKLGQQNPALNSVRDYVDDLARIGSLIHHYVECRIQGLVPETDDWSANEIRTAEPAMAKFDAWLSQHQFKLIASERKMVSDRWRFGGTIDIFAEVDGIRALCDIKTGRGIYREYFYQCSAYAELLREHGERVDEIRILRIGRVGAEGLEERVVRDWSPYWLAFLDLRELYQHEKDIDKIEAGGN